MELRLCYKTYPFKMNLAAMRQFKTKTNKDLWFTLVSFLETYIANQSKPTITLMRALYQCVDFETASEAFHALVKQGDSSIELEQIQDAMFRVGWRPVEDEDSEFIQPWPLILVDVANEIDQEFRATVSDIKKKEQTG
ncbi:hypothetical protein [Alteromonas australica]|uniref:Uncharacterized protein n=1 Tax=Alteromonas australica TaxID=589873 RepID=A0A358E131_9ALTE|nr:hypothetical protein [Alteromonas australica]MBU35306.1 hypothetical protein [Alteromonas sp.]HBU52206.1 hypothetical protein [Alteromonas australica]|tara:strand:- start:12156 stop:12569 length:414 start_codon:yes stop_codon:yes gene_type:complete